MTCIAGLVKDEEVWVGADSAGVDGWDLMVRADEKAFRNADFVFGCCGSFRMMQLLHHAFAPPDRPPKMSVDKYMVTTFVDAARQCLKAGGYQKTDDNVDTGGTFLVGYQGRLFRLEGDYQVGFTTESFDAVGCGDAYAKGVLYELRDANLTPRTKLLRALKAAEHFSAAVRRPFKIMKLSK